MKMRLAFYVSTGGGNSEDEFMTCRGEGRAMINIGLCYGKLGHHVDIIHIQNYDDKRVFGNTYLRKHPDQSVQYDAVFTYNAQPPFSNYNKIFYYIEISNPKNILLDIYNRNKNGIIMVPSSIQYNMIRNGHPWWRSNFDLDNRFSYLPVPYPIPTYKQTEDGDFFPFEFDKNKKKLKIWAYLSGWPNYYINSDDAMLKALRRIREHGYEIDLYVHTFDLSRVTKAVQNIYKEFNPLELKNFDFNYRQILDLISGMDLCITKGSSWACGMCSFDIMALGKPMLYCADYNKVNNINPFLIDDNHVLRMKLGSIVSSPEESALNSKVDTLLSDPLTWYNGMKTKINEHRFPIWKEIAAKLISN